MSTYEYVREPGVLRGVYLLCAVRTAY
jgi:hypothetical protein